MRHLFEIHDPREFDERRACAIAELYATARNDSGRLLTLQELHESDAGNIPSPAVVLRWARESIRFRQALREAERARARLLVEETIAIADDPTRSAAHARNAIDARFRVAEAFHREMFARDGSTSDDPFADSADDVTVERLENMDDKALAAIIHAEQAKRLGLASGEPDPLGGQGG